MNIVHYAYMALLDGFWKPRATISQRTDSRGDFSGAPC